MTDPLKTPVFDFDGGRACLDFANTVGGLRGGVAHEYLETCDDLVAWATQAGLLAEPLARELARRAAKHPQLAMRALARAREVREAIYATFAAAAAKRPAPERSLGILNTILPEAMAHTKLTAVAGGFRWDFAVPEPTLDQPLWMVVRDAAGLLTSDRLALVRECGGDTCSWLFLDTTRNHSRHWCNMKGCGNRAKVRRHRAKQARE